MSLVKCANLSKSYGKKTVLKKINLQISSGKIVGLLGKNGAGKTTLIKLMNGLLTPSSGTIRIDGHAIGIETKRIVSYLPERTFLDLSMRVMQALEFFDDFYDDFDMERAVDLVTKLGLDPQEKIIKMSKGMQEKLQLALVMSRRAKLYILDEPLGGVDPATRDYILDIILDLFSKDASMLISTHLISDLERILDEVILIDNGEVILHEEADEIRQQNNMSIDNFFRRRFKNV